MNALLLAAGFWIKAAAVHIFNAKVFGGGKQPTIAQLLARNFELCKIKNIYINTHWLANEVEKFISNNRWKKKI